MTRRLRPAALGLALLLGTALLAPSTSTAVPIPPQERNALKQSLANLPDAPVTGAQVRVRGTDGRWAGRAGVSDVRTASRVPVAARFRIGSATKMFTAALVLQLASEGRFQLTDTVQQLLPGVLPSRYPPVTVGQLLDHTSGLPMSTEDAGSDDPAWTVRHRFDWHSPNAVVQSATRRRMAFTPGSRQQYNGVNYFLAGMIIERVTGHNFNHELTSRVLRPQRLDDTYLPARGDNRLHGPFTHGYVRIDRGDKDRLVDVSDQSAYAWAEGGMVSTTQDLSRFLNRLLSGHVVPQPWLEHMFVVPPVPNADGSPARFTAGLERTVLPNGQVVFGKSGSTPGYRTLAVATRDRTRLLVVSLTTTGNNDGSEMERLLGVAGAAFGLG